MKLSVRYGWMVHTLQGLSLSGHYLFQPMFRHCLPVPGVHWTVHTLRISADHFLIFRNIKGSPKQFSVRVYRFNISADDVFFIRRTFANVLNLNP